MFLRKSFIALGVILAIGGTSAQAEDTQASSKSLNLSVNPLGLILGSGNLSADFKVSDHIAMGPTISYITSGGASAIAIQANAEFFLSNTVFNSSWYIEPTVGYAIGSSAAAVISGGTLGYHWFWDNGVNFELGLGAKYVFVSDSVSFISGLLPHAELSLGWAF